MTAPARRADPLRPAIELALDVARAGEALSPPVAAPRPLRAILRFRRLTSTVARTVQRAVDDDPDFRTRVAVLADEDELGRPGWLWLTRPEGWRDELDDLLADEEERARDAAVAASQGAVDRERDARRRAEAALTAVRGERDRLAAALEDERRARGALLDDLAAAREELAALGADRDDAVARLKDAEARAVAAATERNDLRRRLRHEGDRSPSGPPPSTAGDAPSVDVDAVVEAVAGAVDRVTGLADALRAVERALGVEREEGTAREPRVDRRGRRAPGAASGARPAGPGDVHPGPPGQARRRTPYVLPGGVRDDSPEAVHALLRVPGAAVLVDGYNVSNAAWAGRDPAEQRGRLLDALGEAAARTGGRFAVVFDGSDVAPGPERLSRRDVTVEFSPPGVEADDVILDRVLDLPATRTVVVVSSDRRVRDGARAAGANVVGAGQLLDAIGIPRRSSRRR